MSISVVRLLFVWFLDKEKCPVSDKRVVRSQGASCLGKCLSRSSDVQTFGKRKEAFGGN